jgi:hypothetical protein
VKKRTNDYTVYKKVEVGCGGEVDDEEREEPRHKMSESTMNMSATT